MDSYFSLESKLLIKTSRDIAIDLGYDYISTIHIFLADCEMNSPSSIKKFAFKDEASFFNFKSGNKKKEINYLDNLDKSLPLTKEAESAIRIAMHEKEISNQHIIQPYHILIGCMQAENSSLAAYFQKEKNVLANLKNYYRELGVFEVDCNTVAEKTGIENKINGRYTFKLLYFIKNIFKLGNIKGD